MKTKSQFKYMMVIHWSDKDESYVAEVPELPGCASHGSTLEKAIRHANDAIETWIEGAQETGITIPEPLALKKYSGRFVTRIDPDLHRSLTLKALEKGKSLNSYVADVLKTATV